MEIAILSPEHFLQKYNRFDYFKKCLVNLKILEFVDQIYVPNYFEIRPSRKKGYGKTYFLNDPREVDLSHTCDVYVYFPCDKPKL